MSQAEKQSRLDRAANSFESIAREWHTIKSPLWSEGTRRHKIRRLEQHIFLWPGNWSIAELEPAEFIAALRHIMVTRCALQLLSLVFVWSGELRHMKWSEIDLEAATFYQQALVCVCCLFQSDTVPIDSLNRTTDDFN